MENDLRRTNDLWRSSARPMPGNEKCDMAETVSKNDLVDSCTIPTVSMSSHSPTFQVAPVVFEVRPGLSIVVRTDPELFKKLLPPPSLPPEASYHNATVIVPSTLDGSEGLHFAH